MSVVYSKAKRMQSGVCCEKRLCFFSTIKTVTSSGHTDSNTHTLRSKSIDILWSLAVDIPFSYEHCCNLEWLYNIVIELSEKFLYDVMGTVV